MSFPALLPILRLSFLPFFLFLLFLVSPTPTHSETVSLGTPDKPGTPYCRPGWLWTYRDLSVPASASGGLVLKSHTTWHSSYILPTLTFAKFPAAGTGMDLIQIPHPRLCAQKSRILSMLTSCGGLHEPIPTAKRNLTE